MFRLSIHDARRIAAQLETEARIRRLIAQVDALIALVKSLSSA